MGKRYQLNTRLLRDDYRLAALTLRKYASLMEANERLFKILPWENNQQHEKLQSIQQAKIRIARMLAKRFRTRADRMQMDETKSTVFESCENVFLNRSSY